MNRAFSVPKTISPKYPRDITLDFYLTNIEINDQNNDIPKITEYIGFTNYTQEDIELSTICESICSDLINPELEKLVNQFIKEISNITKQVVLEYSESHPKPKETLVRKILSKINITKDYQTLLEEYNHLANTTLPILINTAVQNNWELLNPFTELNNYYSKTVRFNQHIKPKIHTPIPENAILFRNADDNDFRPYFLLSNERFITKRLSDNTEPYQKHYEISKLSIPPGQHLICLESFMSNGTYSKSGSIYWKLKNAKTTYTDIEDANRFGTYNSELLQFLMKNQLDNITELIMIKKKTTATNNNEPTQINLTNNYGTKVLERNPYKHKIMFDNTKKCCSTISIKYKKE